MSGPDPSVRGGRGGCTRRRPRAWRCSVCSTTARCTGTSLRKRLTAVLGPFRALVRHALPLPQGAVRARLHHAVAAGRRRRPGHRPTGADRVRLTAAGKERFEQAGRRGRSDDVGGRRLRRPPRVLRSHQRRRPAAHPRGPAQPSRGAPRDGLDLAGPQPRAGRPVHPRAAAARPRVGAARGALAGRA
nr:hypothetical protein [Angustibacter aerolatus]